ncbi:MAG: replicative DNA helicase [Elusimicrobia bacterium]|nr:replicative DNA helicase [Elusimicrobiota bacterium]MBU2615025.1 replicative DNA helicase [Elusimicrobiota bacterium]
MPEMLDKVPPNSVEAEMAILGSMIIEKEAIAKALEIVDEIHFYRDTHRKIFKIIKRFYMENLPVDTVSIIEELKRERLLEEIGGASYIATLINTVSTAANVEHYANIVLNKAILRQLIQAGTQIAEAGYKASDEPRTLIDRAEEMIFAIAQTKEGQGFTQVKATVQSILTRIETLMSDKTAQPGLKTGFAELDERTAGLQPSNLVIVAARPSMGKTSFAMNIAANVAIKDNLPVGIFSIETSKEELIFRLICSEAWVNSHEVRRGILPKKSWAVITSAAEKVYNAPIYIDDTTSISPLEIRTRARRLATELATENKKLSLIVIDYIQMMRGSGRTDSRQQEISEISRSLKGLARELNVPVIALSQLSRKPEERGREGVPQLSDLRESGALEQDADVVMFIYRKEVYSKSPDDEGKANIMIAKQRNGPTGEVEMRFFKEYTRFERLDKSS